MITRIVLTLYSPESYSYKALVWDDSQALVYESLGKLFEMLIPATYHTHSDLLYLGQVPDPRIFNLKWFLGLSVAEEPISGKSYTEASTLRK